MHPEPVPTSRIFPFDPARSRIVLAFLPYSNIFYNQFVYDDGFQVVDLPYDGGRFSMDIILPNSGNSLSGLNVNQLPTNLSG